MLIPSCRHYQSDTLITELFAAMDDVVGEVSWNAVVHVTMLTMYTSCRIRLPREAHQDERQ